MIIFFTFEEILIILMCIFLPCLFFGYKAYELIDFFSDHWLVICIVLVAVIVIGSIVAYWFMEGDLTIKDIVKFDILATPVLLFPAVSVIPAIANAFHEHGVLWGIFFSFIEIIVFLIFFIIMTLAVYIAEFGFFQDEDNRKEITKIIEFIFAIAIEIGAYILYFV